MTDYQKFCITCGKELSIRKIFQSRYDGLNGKREFYEEKYCADGEKQMVKRTWWEKFFCLKLHIPYETNFADMP